MQALLEDVEIYLLHIRKKRLLIRSALNLPRGIGLSLVKGNIRELHRILIPNHVKADVEQVRGLSS